MASAPRPFWAGFDPDKPEPLDKVLAALHCYQVAPRYGDKYEPYFECKVIREDHHRIRNVFPELRKLAVAINRTVPFKFVAMTGKLTAIPGPAYHSGIQTTYCKSFQVMDNALKSLGLDASSAGPLALQVNIAASANDELMTLPAGQHKASAFVLVAMVTGYGSVSKQAQHITKNLDSTQTAVVIEFAVPGRLDSERRIDRLEEKSFVTVFTNVNGKATQVVNREPLSISEGEIKLWLSDLVNSYENLPSQFIRPLSNGENDRPANMTIPYKDLFDSFQRGYMLCIQEDEDNTPPPGPSGPANGPKQASGSGKKFMSTLSSGKDTISTLPGGKKFITTVSGGKDLMSTLPGSDMTKEVPSTRFAPVILLR